MYFRNKNTGVTWHITDKSHQKRLQADGRYVEVTDTNTQEVDDEVDHEPVREDNNSENNIIEYSDLNWNELRKVASDRGINPHGHKRVEIEKMLGDLDANDQQD